MLSKSGKRPDPLNESDLWSIVQEALSLKAYTFEEGRIETLHAKFDHPERPIDVNDVLHGLRKTWKFTRTEKFDTYFWQWHYAIITEDVEGTPLTVIVAVDSRNRTFEVITRW
jgi:hypothetical protein